MDPFEKLPEEIYDQILKHFSVNELLHELSLVSKKWYETIGNSSICMSKIKLDLRSKRRTNFKDRIETLQWMSQKTSRKYIYVQSNCLLDENISLEFFHFLQSCKTIEYLNVRSMKLNDNVESYAAALALPKLEYLKVMFIPREIMNKLIVSSDKLKTLILLSDVPLSYDGIDYLPNDITMECVRKCMENSTSLEELEIQGRANFYSFFHQNIAASKKCQLQKLTVKIEMSPKNLTLEQEQNLIEFLKSNKNSLESIYIDKCGTNLVAHVMNNMPNLSSIRFDNEFTGDNKFDVKELNLLANDKITTFELPYVKLFDDLKDYLELVPNCKKILIGHVIPALLEYVCTNLKSLDTLIYRYDDCFGTCEKLYEDMKRENPEINHSIKLKVCNEFL
jgi:hypothetical protein